MNKNYRRAAQLVALVLLSATLAFAQSSMPASAGGTNDLLEVLRAKGILTEQEYQALKQRVMAPTPAAEAAVPMPAPQTHTPFITMMDTGNWNAHRRSRLEVLRRTERVLCSRQA